MDPTYAALIMPRRKQVSRKGFLPALFAGLAGAKLLSQLGMNLMNRKSGYKKKRRGLANPAIYGYRTPAYDMKTGRKLLGSSRGGKYIRSAKYGMSNKLLKIKRKGKYNKRRGDLDSDFLGEFGNLEYEPTRTKSWGRMALDTLRKVLGKKEYQKYALDTATEQIKNLVTKKSKGKKPDTKIKNEIKKIISNDPTLYRRVR